MSGNLRIDKEAYQWLIEEKNKFSSIVEERLAYIAKTIFAEFSCEIRSSNLIDDLPDRKMYNYKYNIILDLSSEILAIYPFLKKKKISEKVLCFYDKDDNLHHCHSVWSNINEYKFVCWFPTRWLFEDFEEEFRQGRQKYLDEIKNKETNQKENKIKRKKILSKLTKEEKEILGINA